MASISACMVRLARNVRSASITIIEKEGLAILFHTKRADDRFRLITQHEINKGLAPSAFTPGFFAGFTAISE